MKAYCAVSRLPAAGLAVLVAAAGSATSLAAQQAGATADESGSGRRVAYVVDPFSSEARYVVREQLAGVEFPNDAIGVTSALEGQLVVDGSGAVVWEESGFVVDITTLESDKERRDGYIQRRTLESDQYPTVTLALTGAEGLPKVLPESGEITFTLLGDLTVHGTTMPTRWDVAAETREDAIVGAASTSFSFGYFGLQRPRVAVVLSVDDEIRLELDFTLVRENE